MYWKSTGIIILKYQVDVNIRFKLGRLEFNYFDIDLAKIKFFLANI